MYSERVCIFGMQPGEHFLNVNLNFFIFSKNKKIYLVFVLTKTFHGIYPKRCKDLIKALKIRDLCAPLGSKCPATP